MHPLTPNLTELKDEELYAKLQELRSKMAQAYRFGSHNLLTQIQMLIEDYQIEINNRKLAQLESNDSKNLNSLIKIK